MPNNVLEMLLSGIVMSQYFHQFKMCSVTVTKQLLKAIKIVRESPISVLAFIDTTSAIHGI
jgi:hypothetical protein